MRGPNSPSSILHPSLEPPRKRQRTTERELGPATVESSPAPNSGASGAAALSTSPSLPMPSSRPRSRMSMPRMGDTFDVTNGQMGAPSASSVSGSGSTPRSDASHIVADESGAVAGRSGAMRLVDLGSVLPNARRRGSANGAPEDMNCGQKGKAKANKEGAPSPSSGTQTPTLTSQAEDSHSDGRMAWEPIQSDLDSNSNSQRGEVVAEGGADVIASVKSPLAVQQQYIIDDRNGYRLCGSEDEYAILEEPAMRDEEFYIENADCVIRVDNTLFRVHRYFLGRDSSAFQHMFSMPSEDNVQSRNVEGGSDENPIRLYGESVERFRSLLSVIYELPLQLQAYNTPAANVDRLLTICEMTNKYHFASIETWAVDALYNVISGLHGPPQQQYELGRCSSAWMKRLLEVALLCGHTQLRNYVAERWVDRIVARDLRPVHALEIADRSGIRQLQGYSYYVQLLEMGENFDPGVVEDGKQYARSRLGTATATVLAAAGPNGNGDNGSSSARGSAGTAASLTREQKQRLLSGHWSLSRLWETLRTNPPKFQRPDGCTYHQQGCVSTWTQVWREIGKSEATLKHPPGDVLGRLRAMEEQLFMHADLSCALTPQCKRGALLALKSTIKDVQEGLADHFADLSQETAVRGTIAAETS